MSQGQTAGLVRHLPLVLQAAVLMQNVCEATR